MEITKININTNEWEIFALIVIITLIFFLFCLSKIYDNKDDPFF